MIGGLGGAEATLKWRFVDEDECGFALSTFPRVLFKPVHSSVRRGLADAGTRFQIPVKFAKTIGRFRIGCEAGPLVSTVGRSEWLYGLIGGVNVSKKTELMAEIARRVAHQFCARHADGKCGLSTRAE